MTNLRGTKSNILACAMVASVMLTIGVGTAFAATAGAASTERTVTIDALKTPIIDAIDTLFRNSGYKYVIEPGVSGQVTMTLNNLPFSEALKTIIEAADLTAVLKDGTYTIGPKPKPERISPAATDGRGPAPAEAAPAEVAAETPPTDTSAAGSEANPDNTAALPNGPVFYGHEGPFTVLGQPQYYDVGNVRIYSYVPFGTVITQPVPLGAPVAVPPQGLRSVSTQNFLDRLSAIHSLPGFNYGSGLGYGQPILGIARGVPPPLY